VTMRTVINRMRGENKNGREDGSTVGVGGHSNGFTGSGDVDGGQDTKMGGLTNKFKMSPGRGAPLVGTGWNAGCMRPWRSRGWFEDRADGHLLHRPKP